jgi:secreted trypsin-like serine protease
MIKIFVIALFIIFSQAETLETVSKDLEILPQSANFSRIVNGQTASANQFPHQALVFISTIQGTYQCGGSLISSEWVLSAAHCISMARAVRLLLGSVNRNSMPVQRNGVQVHRPSTYNPMTLKDDISLIKVDNPVTTQSNVRPINLPSRTEALKTYTLTVLTVSGFGLTTQDQVSTNLQYTTVIGISNAECRGIYGSMIVPSILCTRGFPNSNQGSCSGDSGGPLVLGQGTNATVVGIVSFGAAQSCTQGFPQGFTRIGHYLSYINAVTGARLEQ